MSHPRLDTIVSKSLQTLPADTPLGEVAAKMISSKIRHLPVTEGGEIVGLISDRDVQRAARVEIFPWSDSQIVHKHFDPALRARDFMSRPVLRVPHESGVEEVISLMLEKRVSSVLVESGGKITGIVTTDDLLRVLSQLVRQEKPPTTRWSLESLRRPIGLLLRELADSGI